MSEKPQPLGGPLRTPSLFILGALLALALGLVVLRFAVGLGHTTNLNDGYPWGVWIAWDVVTGTAFASGGYAIALIVYLANRGRYHPLVRPAMLTSALGYTLAALSVVIDIGRPWNAWKLIRIGTWNHTSVLLEVAVCVLLYTAVLWVEVSPAILERVAEAASWPRLSAAAKVLSRWLTRALPFVLALGMTLPTMHQSSLGSLLLVARFKVHPLWYSPLLPLLFLISCIGMGYAAVVVEGAVSSLAYGRKPEREMLASLGAMIPYLSLAFIGVRLVDLAMRGKLGLVLSAPRHGALFIAELVLFLVPALMLATPSARLRMGNLLRASMLLLIGGTLYRFDAFLVVFNPGAGWHYFPSAMELLVTVGLIAGEILGYAIIVQRFPILSGQTVVPQTGEAI